MTAPTLTAPTTALSPSLVPDLPRPRGPMSEAVLQAIAAAAPGSADSAAGPRSGPLPTPPAHLADAGRSGLPVLTDDDVQLALFLLYGLAYGSLGPAGDALEWDPDLLALRRSLEALHEEALRSHVRGPELPEPTSRAVAAALFALTGADDGPNLSRFAARTATRAQLRELLVLRSVYTLREADPHSWAIPRLTGRAKAALVEIQSDEYGNGRPDAVHAALFAQAMRGAGLSDQQLAYLDQVPAVTLASHNTMSLFGMHRRLLGCVIGHLTAFEMTSSAPNAMYRDGFDRAGYGSDVTAYFAEHVTADAVHEQIAAHDMAGTLAEQEPHRVPDIMFGAAASLALDALVGQHVMDAWQEGRSALAHPGRLPQDPDGEPA